LYTIGIIYYNILISQELRLGKQRRKNVHTGRIGIAFKFILTRRRTNILVTFINSYYKVDPNLYHQNIRKSNIKDRKN